MRALYRLLLRLYPAATRSEFGAEMLRVFDAASAEARRRGPAAYVQFCAREAAGLLFNAVVEGRTMKHRKAILQGLAAGLLIGLAVAGAWATRPYTSTVVVRANPPVIPERLVSPQPSVEIGRVVPVLLQTVMSRGTLSSVINTYGLYGSERGRMPLEDVVEEMRRNIQYEASDLGTVRLSFSYPDRMLAQKVTADLVSRMIGEYTRTRTMQAELTVQFLKDSAEKAAMQWEESLAAIRAAEAAGKSLARARLDADIARQRYETLSVRIAEAEMSADMERRQQGQTLELLDPASLPYDRRPPIAYAAGAGALTGAVLGWLISAVLSRRAANAVAPAH
jgi:hypothetical protein